MRVKAYILSGILLSMSQISYAGHCDTNQTIGNDNSSCDYNGMKLESISFDGPGTVWGGNRKLEINNPDNHEYVNIGWITNNWNFFGKGYSAELVVKNAQNVHIDKIHHKNYTGGSWLHIKADNKLSINEVFFNDDGIDGSQGHIEIQAKEVNVTNLTGRKQQHIYIKNGLNGNGDKADKIVVGNLAFAEDICITDSCGGTITLEGKDVIIKKTAGGNGSEGGIRAGNFVTVKGDNFYGGRIEAIGLPTKGSDSTLDLTGVSGTTFIDDFYIRSGTLKANNFHINNLNVRKSNTFSQVNYNIGKSFINYLSMEIGTSGFADGSELKFNGGGDILNFNFIENCQPTGRWDVAHIKETNINDIFIRNSWIWMNKANINTMVVRTSQLGFGIFDKLVKDDTKLYAHSLNVNNLLHLKKASAYNGYMQIILDRSDVANNGSSSSTQNDFSKHLKLNVDSKALQNMNKDEIAKLIESSKNQNNNKTESDYKNASGTYITTSDGKHFVILPDIMTNKDIENNKWQAANGGTILVEQHEFQAKTLNNYGTILLDSSFFGNDDSGKSKDALLIVEGSLNNHNTIDIGANGVIEIKNGDFTNKGKMLFRIQSTEAIQAKKM